MCRNVASVDLTSRWQPMTTRIVPHMLRRASDHDGTIRWSTCHSFQRVVLASCQQAHMNHHQCVGLMHAETTCVVKTDSVAQQTRCVRRPRQPMHGTQPADKTTRPMYRDVASESLTDRCQPMVTRIHFLFLVLVSGASGFRCHIHLRRLLTTMGQSDGHSDETFQKWSWRTTNRPRWTISDV